MQLRDPPEPFENRAVSAIPDRRIAAIVAADVVEYTRLMGVDEEPTRAGLRLRRSIFGRLVAECGGHELGSVGDSLVAEFPSAVNASIG